MTLSLLFIQFILAGGVLSPAGPSQIGLIIRWNS